MRQSIPFADHFRAVRASAILRCDDPELGAAAMEAAVRGGFSIVEFTLTIPGAYDLIQLYSHRDDLVVGAGTVLTRNHAETAVAAGARFLVSPILDPEIVDVALSLDVPIVPGVHTPTEAVAAYRAGAELQKVFPAPAGGPAWVRSTLAPLPFLRLVPTNGVDEHNVRAYLDAGAWAVGFTTALFEPSALANQDFVRIEERARILLAAVADAEVGIPS